MTEIEAICGTIPHWERMIEAVRNSLKDPKHALAGKIPSPKAMFLAIGETWFGEYCPLCEYDKEQARLDPEFFPGVCQHCPLYKYLGTACGVPGTPWMKVNNSQTWEEWLNNAYEMLNRLQELKIRTLAAQTKS
jgi:hypothetical protein